jgi:hypothetical protein
VNFSKPSLHAPVLELAPHRASVAAELASVRAELVARAQKLTVPPIDTVDIPLTTVSLNSNFDAYVNVRFRGQPPACLTSLLVDSGNSTLIVPYYDQIASLETFSSDYQILAEAIQEPWGCPAKLLRGPVEIPTRTGDIMS